ncbi:MAG: DNA mismatch endonuclease Vsr [Ignavibacteriaceae bacterium]|nr:DNA mismatch endonuclease Vsr [Ignavibacteriaceae bacterium]
MTDVHSPEVRSFNMSKIRGKDTKPELIVRKFLFSKGFRYRLHDKLLPGKPDIVLKRANTIIFINGCFWHGHKRCKYFVIPKTRTEWWLNKINDNIKKDRQIIAELKNNGWVVLILWECELKKKNREFTLNKLYNRLTFNNG